MINKIKGGKPKVRYLISLLAYRLENLDRQNQTALVTLPERRHLVHT